MVSILPAGTSPWDVIGQSIGQNLSATLPQAAQQYGQRQMSLRAIDDLQKGLAAAKGNPSLMLPLLMKAYAMSPGLERSGLGTKALELAGASQFGPALGEATGAGANALGEATGTAGPTPQTPGMVPKNAPPPPVSSESVPLPETPKGKWSANDVDNAANQLIGEIRPDLVNPATEYGAINTFDAAIKMDLTPEEEADLTQRLMKKYGNPEIVNSVIGRIREGIKNKYNEAKEKYGFDADRLKQIQQKWDQFTSQTPARLSPILEKYGNNYPRTQEFLINKYNSYAGKSNTNMTPQDMHTQAQAKLQNDINKIDALHAIPAMPPMRTAEDAREYLDGLKDTYKDMAKTGMAEVLREDAILNKDMGNEEFHATMWGDQTSKPLLNQIHSLKAPVEYEQIQGAPIGHTRYNKDYPKKRENYINSLTNSLKHLKPDDDLMLARAMVLDNNGTIKDFKDALNRAQEEGLKLSEFQRSQLQEITIPRRPPLWEIFSGFNEPMTMGKLIGGGLVTGANWEPFINYIRGKK